MGGESSPFNLETFNWQRDGQKPWGVVPHLGKTSGEFVDFFVELYPWWIFLSSHVSFQGGGVGFCPFFGGRKGVSTVYLDVKRLVNSPFLLGCFMFVVAVKTYQFLVALETFKSLKLAVGVLYTVWSSQHYSLLG